MGTAAQAPEKPALGPGVREGDGASWGGPWRGPAAEEKKAEDEERYEKNGKAKNLSEERKNIAQKSLYGKITVKPINIHIRETRNS